MSTDNMIIKRGNVELNVEPLFDFMDVYGEPKEVSEKVEEFVDAVLPFASEAFENGGVADLLNSLDYVNQIKILFRKM